MIMYSNDPPSEAHVARVQSARQDLRVVIAESESETIRHTADTDITLGHRYLRQTLKHTQDLE